MGVQQLLKEVNSRVVSHVHCIYICCLLVIHVVLPCYVMHWAVHIMHWAVLLVLKQKGLLMGCWCRKTQKRRKQQTTNHQVGPSDTGLQQSLVLWF